MKEVGWRLTPWTGQEKKDICALYTSGKSTREISIIYTEIKGKSISRSAIIGLVQRNLKTGAPRASYPDQTRAAYKPRQEHGYLDVRSPADRGKGGRTPVPPKIKPAPVIVADDDDLDAIPPEGIPDFKEAKNDVARVAPAAMLRHHCRWPVGDPREASFGFCGAARGESGPYCEDHRVRAAGKAATPAQVAAARAMRAAKKLIAKPGFR